MKKRRLIGTKRTQSIIRGRRKIEAFIQRGIRLNSRPNFMKRVSQAVRQAIYDN